MASAHQASLEQRMLENLQSGTITGEQMEKFLDFVEQKKREIDDDEIIKNNEYTKWWKRGRANLAQIKDFISQFGVFSKRFPLIQALRVYYAQTEEEENAARDILVNESGVDIDMPTGSTDGKIFRHRNAHIKWLRDIGEKYGFDRMELGNWDSGTLSTQEFLNRLTDLFGNPDRNKRAGASFALETWAGYGIGQGVEAESNNFWFELVAGCKALGIPTGFFKYHANLERAHVENVEHELEETFFHPEFNQEKWFQGAREALDALLIFWTGLDETRKQLEQKTTE